MSRTVWEPGLFLWRRCLGKGYCVDHNKPNPSASEKNSNLQSYTYVIYQSLITEFYWTFFLRFLKTDFYH